MPCLRMLEWVGSGCRQILSKSGASVSVECHRLPVLLATILPVDLVIPLSSSFD